MNYRPDRLGFAPDDPLLNLAIAVVESTHNLHLPEWTELVNRAERLAMRNRVGRIIKNREQIALYQWAMKEGYISQPKPFTEAWKRDGRRGGAEHEVYFDEEMQGWWKRNTLSYHDTYLSFFQRLALHLCLFPEAPLKMKGFMVDYNRATLSRAQMLKPVLFQAHVRSHRGADEPEVTKLMKSLGGSRVGTHDYLYSGLQVRVEDLHDENALICDEEVMIVDPVLYLEETGKRQRLAERGSAASMNLSPAHIHRNERVLAVMRQQGRVSAAEAYAQYDFIKNAKPERLKKRRNVSG